MLLRSSSASLTSSISGGAGTISAARDARPFPLRAAVALRLLADGVADRLRPSAPTCPAATAATASPDCCTLRGVRDGLYVCGKYSVNVLPVPGLDASLISPPSSLDSSRLIARPRPVPPYLRLVEPSAC